MENVNKLNHLAVIIDGNRRYASSKGLNSFKGHEYGADKVDELINWCKELGIKEITIYALSTENLKRTPEELKMLFKLFKKWFTKFKKDKKVHEDRVRIKFIGDLDLVPKDIKELALEIEKDTKNYDNYLLNFCFAYGGRLELIEAFNKLIKEGKKEISEEDIKNALWLKSEPDLIIRTGGKARTSNFLPWQSAYSEWVFLDTLWPEFSKKDLIDSIKKFESIKRNMGK